MPKTDTSEWALESLIVAALTGQTSGGAADRQIGEHELPYGGAGYVEGDPQDYDRDHAVDVAQLLAFLQATQPQVFGRLAVAETGPSRDKFLARLQGEIAKRGVVDVLREGIKHGPASIDLFYGTPSPGNTTASERYDANIFSVTRQLRYSRDNTQKNTNQYCENESKHGKLECRRKKQNKVFTHGSIIQKRLTHITSE